ncbi:MAG: hypothetical protein GXP49_10360 [Deltaproteobacteria bacterium]|nr:hypothetical protein [Deltaproteobacteria bacterium]
MNILRRLERQENGNALWVSVLLISTMVWVGFVSVRLTTSELKASGNLRETQLLKQVTEGALNQLVGLCDRNPSQFAEKSWEVNNPFTLGTPVAALNCSATAGTCTLDPKFTSAAEFRDFVGAFTPTFDPHGRGGYDYSVFLFNHGPEIPMALDGKFCMQKLDVLVQSKAPGTGDQPLMFSRGTITAQPVACRSQH